MCLINTEETLKTLIISYLALLKCSNQTIKEQKTMQELQSRNYIVINDANKDEAVVMLGVKDYTKEEKTQLSNKETYKLQNNKTTNYNPTAANNETVNKFMSRFQKENLLTKNISEGLKAPNPKTSYFYLKPKIHKKGYEYFC